MLIKNNKKDEIINDINIGKNLIDKLICRDAVEKNYFDKFFIKQDQKTTRYSGRRIAALPSSTVSRLNIRDVYFYNEIAGSSFVSSHLSAAVPKELQKKKNIYMDFFIRPRDFWQPAKTNIGRNHLKRKRKDILKKELISFFSAQPAPILHIPGKKRLYSYSPSQVELVRFYNTSNNDFTVKKLKGKARKIRRPFFKEKYHRQFKLFFNRGVVDKNTLRKIGIVYETRLFAARRVNKRFLARAARRFLSNVSY